MANEGLTPLEARVVATMTHHALVTPEDAVLLMVSGGSDSVALAYLFARLHEAGVCGSLALFHVNHQLRGEDADADETFVEGLADLLAVAFFGYRVPVATLAEKRGENVEMTGRKERYRLADEALRTFTGQVSVPAAKGRIATAHTADDRIENFYMRSIVGTGPGGFRSLRYRNGHVIRPLLGIDREELRTYLREREAAGLPAMRDGQGALWREDATNAHTDRFRAFVRHELIPVAKSWNPSLTAVLGRTMDLIGEEDDMLTAMAFDVAERYLVSLGEENPSHIREEGDATEVGNAVVHEEDSAAGTTEAGSAVDHEEDGTGTVRTDEPAASPFDIPDFGLPQVGPQGFMLLPPFGQVKLPLARRVIFRALQSMIGPDARVDASSVAAILAAFENGVPHSGYVVNIQNNIAVTSNKKGVRVEPMESYRMRRGRMKKTPRIEVEERPEVEQPGVSTEGHGAPVEWSATSDESPDTTAEEHAVPVECPDATADRPDLIIYLASKSPRRKQLLEDAGIAFTVRTPLDEVDEKLDDAEWANPEEACKKLAERKAGALVQEILAEEFTGMALVIGADTIVVKDGEVFGKPRNISHAMSMLRTLSGSTHEVVTAVSLWLISAPDVESVSLGFRTLADTSLVTFHPLDDNQIRDYLRKGESFDKAGAYAAQGEGAALIERIDGSLDTVIGLPVQRLIREFPDFFS